ncbi:LexA repressor [compost metagenome]
MVKVPLIRDIASGNKLDRIENTLDIEFVKKTVIKDCEAFALEVKGDSMIGDNIVDGDIVICVKQSSVLPTDIAVVALNGETATVKRIKRQEQMCLLMTSNPKIQPIMVHASEVEIIGRVVEVRRRY